MSVPATNNDQARSAERFLVPAPANVPPDFARPSVGYRLRVLLSLFGLLLFLLFYLALMAGSLFLLVWAVAPPAEIWERLPDTTGAAVFYYVVRAGVLLAAGLVFIFLFKGFFARGPIGTEHCVVVSEEDQPDLVGCVRAVCREIGSPEPAAIYLSHEVNAGIHYHTSIVNLFVSPPKNLILGLGLVRDLNLVEFKALLAHEFGHSSQRALRLSGYLGLVHLVLFNMVHMRDRWDDRIIRWSSVPFLSAVAVPVDMLLGGARRVLAGLFRILDSAHRSLLWEMEYNADLVAVSAAGSDAIVHVLAKSQRGHVRQQKALANLAQAVEHELFARDVFAYQDRATRDISEDETQPLPFGPDPVLPKDAPPPAGMWVDHPPSSDRERNAKRRYYPSPRDERSAWVLLRDVEQIQEEVTRRFYETALLRDLPETLAEAEEIDAFLREEQVALEQDPRWHGIYRNRYLDPGLLAGDFTGAGLGDSAELDERLARVQADASDLAPLAPLNRPEDQQRFAQFDRSVFDLHCCLARDLGREEELTRWYRFHIDLQPLHAWAYQQKDRLAQVRDFLHGRTELRPEEVGQTSSVLQEVAEGMTEVHRVSGGLRLPPLKNLPAGAPLPQVLPAAQMPDVSSPDAILTPNLLAWMEGQVFGTLRKLDDVLVKSLNGLLALQDQIVVEWKSSRGAAAEDGAG